MALAQSLWMGCLMKFQARVETGGVRQGGGKVRISYTIGETPLPVGHGGLGLEFASEADFLEHMALFRQTLPETLLNIMFAVWAIRNPDLGNPNQLAGHSATLDFDVFPPTLTFT